MELYSLNILDRGRAQAGIDFWTTVLEDANVSPVDVLVAFAAAPENRASLEITVADNGDCTWKVDVLLL